MFPPDFQVSESQADLFQTPCSFGQNTCLGFPLLGMSCVSFLQHTNPSQKAAASFVFLSILVFFDSFLL